MGEKNSRPIIHTRDGRCWFSFDLCCATPLGRRCQSMRACAALPRQEEWEWEWEGGILEENSCPIYLSGIIDRPYRVVREDIGWWAKEGRGERKGIFCNSGFFEIQKGKEDMWIWITVVVDAFCFFLYSERKNENILHIFPMICVKYYIQELFILILKNYSIINIFYYWFKNLLFFFKKCCIIIGVLWKY